MPLTPQAVGIRSPALTHRADAAPRGGQGENLTYSHL